MTKWDAGQWFSGVLVIIGICIEVAYKAHVGFVFISLGGLSWGIFTKLKGR